MHFWHAAKYNRPVCVVSKYVCRSDPLQKRGQIPKSSWFRQCAFVFVLHQSCHDHGPRVAACCSSCGLSAVKLNEKYYYYYYHTVVHRKVIVHFAFLVNFVNHSRVKTFFFKVSPSIAIYPFIGLISWNYGHSLYILYLLT